MNLDVNDVDSKFIVETISNKWGNKFFELRPSAALSFFGMVDV
jgi:uncharacterized protein (DUF2164 family)